MSFRLRATDRKQLSIERWTNTFVVDCEDQVEKCQPTSVILVTLCMSKL